VLVVDPDGKIGTATADEIEYATALGKSVRYLSAERPGPPPTVVDPMAALRESHEVQRLVTNEVPTLDVPNSVKELRCALIEEEAAEFRAAVKANDIIEVADAIADLLYVVYGAALTFGIPVREVFTEVHRSNMTKLDDDGGPIYRADGKVMKGPNFSPPNLGPILDAAAARHES
jgi:predicted HAD superfamily Cof-like phosphohydrolase